MVSKASEDLPEPDKPGHHDQPVAGQRQIDVLEVVFARALDDDGVESVRLPVRHDSLYTPGVEAPLRLGCRLEVLPGGGVVRRLGVRGRRRGRLRRVHGRAGRVGGRARGEYAVGPPAYGAAPGVYGLVGPAPGAYGFVRPGPCRARYSPTMTSIAYATTIWVITAADDRADERREVERRGEKPPTSAMTKISTAMMSVGTNARGGQPERLGDRGEAGRVAHDRRRERVEREEAVAPAAPGRASGSPGPSPR